MNSSVFFRAFFIGSLLLVISACGLTPSKPVEPIVAEAVVPPKVQAEKPIVIEIEPPKLVEESVKQEVIEVEKTPPKVCAVNKTEIETKKAKKIINTHLLIIGAVEYVTIKDHDLRLKARIDTGAQTSSIGVDWVQIFERDGDRWVMFAIKDRNTKKVVKFKRPLKRNVRIKQHEQALLDRRHVVEMKLSLGSITRKVEVTLNNRDDFKYPVLIGRNFLDAQAVVDVSSRYLMLDKEN